MQTRRSRRARRGPRECEWPCPARPPARAAAHAGAAGRIVLGQRGGPLQLEQRLGKPRRSSRARSPQRARRSRRLLETGPEQQQGSTWSETPSREGGHSRRRRPASQPAAGWWCGWIQATRPWPPSFPAAPLHLRAQARPGRGGFPLLTPAPGVAPTRAEPRAGPGFLRATPVSQGAPALGGNRGGDRRTSCTRGTAVRPAGQSARHQRFPAPQELLALPTWGEGDLKPKSLLRCGWGGADAGGIQRHQPCWEPLLRHLQQVKDDLLSVLPLPLPLTLPLPLMTATWMRMRMTTNALPHGRVLAWRWILPPPAPRRASSGQERCHLRATASWPARLMPQPKLCLSALLWVGPRALRGLAMPG